MTRWRWCNLTGFVEKSIGRVIFGGVTSMEDLRPKITRSILISTPN